MDYRVVRILGLVLTAAAAQSALTLAGAAWWGPEGLATVSLALTSALTLGCFACWLGQREQARAVLFLRGVLDAQTIHLAVLDERGIIRNVNAAWRRFAAENGLRDPEYAVGLDYLDHCHAPAEALTVHDGLRAVLTGTLDRFSGEYPCPGAGDQRWFSVGITRCPGVWPPRVVVAHADITARVRAEEELRRGNEKLREAASQKDEFLAMLAHELRNPLAPMRNAAGVLRLRGDDRATVDWARDVIERQTEHMVRMVDDLLDASRIARGKVRLRRQHLDLAQMVGTILADHRGTLAASGLELTSDLPTAPVPLLGDPVRLGQVLTNLLHNAAKFTDPPGQIHVRLTRVPTEAPGGAGTEAVLEVRDSGIGIDGELLGRLFDAFSQGDRTLERSKGGLGLGLAIVKGLVELHAGSVSAASEGPDRGAHLHRPPARRRAGGAPPTLPLPRRGRAAPRARRVLIIEDNVDAAVSLRIILELRGHEVRLAHNGRAGLGLIHSWSPEVVLCDLGLPELSGFEVARAAQAHPGGDGLRLIAISGYAQAADQRRAREAGFDDALVKPVDPELLAEVVAQA